MHRAVGDERCDLGELVAVGFHEELVKGDAARLGQSVRCFTLHVDDRAALFHDIEGALESVATAHVEDEVAGFDDVLELFVRVAVTEVEPVGRIADACSDISTKSPCQE